MLKTDLSAFIRIFNNLISNAIKYNKEKGSIKIRIVSSKIAYQIEVIDTGIGMTEDTLKKAFDPFFRADTSRSERDSLGIGLVEALKQNNIRVPEDVAVAGFDNIVLAEFLTPKLTTISIDHMEWGKCVATSLIDLINDRIPSEITPPKGCIIYRESC